MHSPGRSLVQVFGALVAVSLLTQCADPNQTLNPSDRPTSPSADFLTTPPPQKNTDLTSQDPSPFSTYTEPTPAAPDEKIYPSTGASQVPPLSTEAPSPTLLTQKGIGALEVGAALSASDVESYFDLTLSPRPMDEYCSLLINEDVGLATVNDQYLATLAFIVDNPAVNTAKDIGVGSSYEDVLAAYGDSVEVLDRPSQTGGPLIALDNSGQPDSQYADDSELIAFDTDLNGTVTRVRVGMYPWVTYTDYCEQELTPRIHEKTGWPLTRLTSSSD